MATLKAVGLEGLEHRRPNELSGGQQQRVAVARAIAGHPALVLADEPTGNLDSRNGDEVMQFLLDFAESLETALVVVTHDTELAKRGDRTLVIKDGVIV